MKFLGIDWGTQHMGIALSDDEGHIAFAYDVLAAMREFVLWLREHIIVPVLEVQEGRSTKGLQELKAVKPSQRVRSKISQTITGARDQFSAVLMLQAFIEGSRNL